MSLTPFPEPTDTVLSQLQVTIEETPFRKLTAKLQFPEDYPAAAVTVHTQSATLDEGLLERLAASANSAVAVKRGQPHAAVATDLIVKFVASNCLATAYADLSQLREFFTENNSRSGKLCLLMVCCVPMHCVNHPV